MRRAVATVVGPGADGLPAAVKRAVADWGLEHRCIELGPTTVIAIERYSRLTQASILGCIVVHTTSPDLAGVEILTGGGRPFFGITWGAQGGFGRQLFRLLEETCRARSLELRDGDGRAPK